MRLEDGDDAARVQRARGGDRRARPRSGGARSRRPPARRRPSPPGARSAARRPRSPPARRPQPSRSAPASRHASSAAAALRALCAPGTRSAHLVPAPGEARPGRGQLDVEAPKRRLGVPARSTKASASRRRPPRRAGARAGTPRRPPRARPARRRSRGGRARRWSRPRSSDVERQHRAVGLVGLDDQPLARAPVGVRAGRAQLAADEVRRAPARTRSSAWATIEAVVVLPWAPATAIVRRSAVSSPSSSPRGLAQARLARRRARGCRPGSPSSRELDVVAGGHVGGVVADADVDAERAERARARATPRGPSR